MEKLPLEHGMPAAADKAILDLLAPMCGNHRNLMINALVDLACVTAIHSGVSPEAFAASVKKSWRAVADSVNADALAGCQAMADPKPLTSRRIKGKHRDPSGNLYLSGDLSGIRGDVSGLWGIMKGLHGYASGLSGDVTDLEGDLTLIPQSARPCHLNEWVRDQAEEGRE